MHKIRFVLKFGWGIPGGSTPWNLLGYVSLNAEGSARPQDPPGSAGGMCVWCVCADGAWATLPRAELFGQVQQ